ncbi:Phosphatidylglycerol/phosphatidylinositol transfer protein [Coemansia sp. RSA 2049]|nr:Phosphatidylglycerol/phosphatidylinositol transfer protein [Coemansia sp. RSA 2049]KAJ2517055.1 Phosphatidylglycerol/phosphatidylinositol transfer protein [Coemansia sp. RSA 1939]KAJ2611821.1 Phosphatidylglycerol/phosphatidylinositol transfer protein [Coemansia sp. RSA 1804]
MRPGSMVAAAAAALCATQQTSVVLAAGDGQFQMVIQEATGIFADIQVVGQRPWAPVTKEGADGDVGKNHTLNDIIRDISEDDDIVDIEYVTLDPEKPKRSSPVHLNALAHIKEPIAAATANVRVKYGFLTLLNRNYNLCEELKSNLNKTCPVDKGPIEVDIDVDIPGFIPPGWFHLDAYAWRDSDEKHLGHILADVRF